MPENNKLKPTGFPMEVKFDKEPKTNFENNLEAIKVTLMNAPTMEDLRKYAIDFATATWEDTPIHCTNLTEKEQDHLIWLAFNRKILPSVLETIRLNFLFDGVSYQDLTHIIRYRTATFSVECSGDKWWTDKDAVIPTSIENSPEFLERFKKLTLDAKQLYVDMLNSREISLLDARFVLQRCMKTYCWVSLSLADALHLINQRIDKQIQPDSDNVLAYRIIQELLKYYPLLSFLFDLHKPAAFYVATARTGRCTNLFVPDEDTDVYEWNREDYLYQRTRDKVNGTDKVAAQLHYPFAKILREVDNDIAFNREMCKVFYGEDFFRLDV